MWDCCCESVKKIQKSHGSGCILAHCMGLGKTLQVRRGAQHTFLLPWDINYNVENDTLPIRLERCVSAVFRLFASHLCVIEMTFNLGFVYAVFSF